MERGIATNRLYTRRMRGLRLVAVSAFVVALAVACGGAGADGMGAAHPQSTAEICPVTVAPSVASCSSRTIPPGDGPPSDRCKSDADCKGQYGTDARCIKNPTFGEYAPRPPGNLLAAPPPPPTPSICVADACHTDADCGPHLKCVCGAGRGSDRNRCVATDACRSDRDCGADHVCNCGASGNANYCVVGNCHADADCEGGLKCENARCHTKNDKCRAYADCKPGQMCSWDDGYRAWACRDVPPVPPG